MQLAAGNGRPPAGAVTSDAGRAAFEELKRLSTPLVEFVAADKGIPPEIVFKVLISLGNAVRLSAGQAAAAVLRKASRASDGSRGAARHPGYCRQGAMPTDSGAPGALR